MQGVQDATQAMGTIGTAVLASSTTSPVTATFGTGQNAGAGNLMLAVVTASGTTSVTTTAQNTGTTGWTKQLEEFNGTTSGVVVIDYWTKKTVVGTTESAPAFTCTLSGTAVMTCTVIEISGISRATTFDRSNLLANGATSSTITSQTLATAAAARKPGELAFMTFIRQRAAGTTTFTPGTGWTLLASDGATSQTAHTAVTVFNSDVPMAGTISQTGTWSGTGTTAFGAGIVGVFAGNWTGSIYNDAVNRAAVW